MSSLFEEGGEHQIQHLGGDEYRFQIQLPTDAEGMLARFCVKSDCAPGYFKVKPGTGIVGGHEVAFCPYCQSSGDPKDFATPEQIEFGKNVLLREAQKGMNKMVKEAFGLGPSNKKKISGGLISMEISLKSDSPRPVPRPLEEELRRDIICSSCGLEHSVYGLAFWCPDCGKDVFLSHVEAELDVIRQIVLSVPDRREKLGVRIAAKDLDNSLEDIVSIFETVLKIITRRFLEKNDLAEGSWRELQQKVIRNKFQNLHSASTLIQELVKVDLYGRLPSSELDILRATFEKRHPITHNLGIIDHSYIKRINSGELGKEVRVTGEELLAVIDIVLKVLTDLHNQTSADLRSEG